MEGNQPRGGHMTSAASDQIYCFKCRSKTDTLEARKWS